MNLMEIILERKYRLEIDFGKLKERRILYNLAVTYDTPNTKLKKIPKIIEEIIAKEKKCM